MKKIDYFQFNNIILRKNKQEYNLINIYNRS